MNDNRTPENRSLEDRTLREAQRSEGLRVALSWAAFAALVAIVVGLTLTFSGTKDTQQAAAPAASTAQ